MEKAKKSQPTPSRPAPPPPEDVESSDEANANKKKGRLFKRSKDKGKKSQTPAQPPNDTSQAKPASKATPPSKDKAAQPVKAAASPMEYSRSPFEQESDDDEPREVENKVYMFDTESESGDDEVADVKLPRKAPIDPNVAEIEQSMRTLGKS